MSTEFPKDKYGYEIPRCHHVSLTGDTCEAPPQTGRHYCFFHDPEQKEYREEANRNGGFNRRQPEPPPLIPPGLPRISLSTPDDVASLYEETINDVRQGLMDLRVAKTLGYLATGWLYAFQTGTRADRQAEQDAAKAAEKAAKQEAQKAEAAAAVPSTDGVEYRDKYGRKKRCDNITLQLTKVATGETESFKVTANGFVPLGDPALYAHQTGPISPLMFETTPEELAEITRLRPEGFTPPGFSIPAAPPNSTATRTHDLPLPTAPPGNQEKPKRDRYTATETGPPEIPTY